MMPAYVSALPPIGKNKRNAVTLLTFLPSYDITCLTLSQAASTNDNPSLKCGYSFLEAS